ncbi:MAG: EI24 domain-containing protein [Nitrospinae bacterium]|nr:EI24 domain-containing protein [Nitrospinota bacterium]
MAPITAVKFLFRHKGLLRFLVIPFLINTAVFSFFLYFAAHWLLGIIGSFLPDPEASSLLRILNYALVGLSFALVLLISVVCFSIVGKIIAFPFADLLTQKVEEIVTGTHVEDSGLFLGNLGKIVRGMREELKRIGFVLFVFFLLFPLNLLPGLGQVLYLFLNSLVVAVFLGLEFFSYSMDRRSFTFRQKMGFARRRFLNVLGVGISAYALMLVPLVNFGVLPLAAVGATLDFFEYELDKPE